MNRSAKADPWEMIEEIERECAQCDDAEAGVNRIERLIAEWRGTSDLAPAAKSAVKHWDEFGPEHGFAFAVERLRAALQQNATRPRTSAGGGRAD